jgi:hypothetical protein
MLLINERKKMEESKKKELWMDFSWRVIQSVSDPIHRHKLNDDWNSLAKRIMKLENE